MRKRGLPRPRTCLKSVQGGSRSSTPDFLITGPRAPQQLIKQGVAMGTGIRQKTMQPKHWAPGPEEAVDECG